MLASASLRGTLWPSVAYCSLVYSVAPSAVRCWAAMQHSQPLLSSMNCSLAGAVDWTLGHWVDWTWSVVSVCACDRSGQQMTARSRSAWRSCYQLGHTSTLRRCCSHTSAAWSRLSRTARWLSNVAMWTTSRLRKVSR